MKILGKIVLVLLIALVAATGWMMYRPSSPNAIILTGGPVLTMNPEQPIAEAVLVREGIIQAVGNASELIAHAPDATVTDLKGGTLIPGLIEPHTHPLASALLGATVDVSGFRYKNRREIIEELKKAANGFGLTPWVIAYGWDPLIVSDLEAPTLDELDQISPDKPMVILTQMLHEVFANSKALQAAGMEIDNPDQIVEGYLRDENGRLTGTVKEVKAVDRLIQNMPSASTSITELLLRLQYVKYAKAGYTTIGVAGAVGRHSDPVGLLQKIGNNPDSPLRTFVYLLPEQKKGAARPLSDDFKVKGIKFWMDGSPFTGGAAMEGHYENSKLATERLGLPHNHTGSLNFSSATFHNLVRKYHEEGMQIAVHVQGERAIEETLNAIEEAQVISPNPTLHHRMEHNALITRDQLARAKRLGMTAGFFVDHIYYYGDALPDLMGVDRMKRYMPLKTALEEGVIITLHGDHPATPIDPFRTMQTAVSRLSESGKTISGAGQKISRLEALKALTINAAIQLGEQDNIGTIAVGKLADFTVLSQNPLDERTKLSAMEVLGIYKNGRQSDTRLVSPTHLVLVWTILKEKILGSKS